MSYRIDYSSGRTHRSRGKPVRTTAMFFLLFLLLCHLFWPDGEKTIKQMLFPWDADVTAGAFSEFVTEMRWGTSFSQAAETFCRTVVGQSEDIH